MPKINTLREKLSQANDDESKSVLYKNLLKQPEANRDDFLNYAIFLRGSNQLRESLVILDKTEDKFGENQWIEDNRARTLAGLQENEAAAQAWEAAISLADGNEGLVFLKEIEKIYPLLNNGIEQQTSKAKLDNNWNEVVVILKKLLQIQPSNLNIYLELSIAYRNKKDITNALLILNLAESAGIESPWIHDNYVRAYLERKLYKRAIKHAELAIGIATGAKQKILLQNLLDTAKTLQNDNQDPCVEVIEKIHDSGLFDEHYYTQHNADLDAQLLDMLVHFVTYGWKEGRNPNQYFSVFWYAEQYELDASSNPVVHYIDSGQWQLLDTSPNFCTRQYLANYKSEIQQYVDPLAYFINIGQQIGHKAFKVAFVSGISKSAIKNATSSVAKDLQAYAHFQGKQPFNGHSQHYHSDKLTLHWVVPDFIEGSGGHMTIFRMINYLERFGHQNTVWIGGKHYNDSCTTSYETVIKHYQFISAEIKFMTAEFYNIEADAVIATSWDTVWNALENNKIKRAFYFVQDFEPDFYPAGARAIIAEETYRQDIDCICASPWLAQTMSTQYGRWASSFTLAYDSKSYYPEDKKKINTDKIEIAVYYRPLTERRAVDLALLGLEQLARQLTDFRVHFFGNSQPVNFDTPYEYISHGVLTVTELGDLYRACNIGITFSVTNYSLIPQEMMACNLPVVELDTECCRSVFPEHTICLTKPHPIAIADNITQLVKDQQQADRQIQAAQQWVSQFSWEKSARIVESSIVERLAYFDFKCVDKLPATTKRPEISVIIPSYNGGELFKKVIQQVLAQELPWVYEVIVIDSSSDDGTAEFLQEQSGIKVHSLPKKDFQHGRTRNLGIELAQGEYIAFLTQDALPASEYWLYYLIASLKKYPKAAGVFGKHLAYNNASPFVKRDLKNHFEAFDNNTLCVSKFFDSQKYEQENQEWLQFLRFYSDNNSALRKDVWQRIPLPEIVFGEDQAWAKAIIDAGYEKIYSPHGLVYHSHNYDYNEKFARAFAEYSFFKDEFGEQLDTVNSEILNNELKALNHRDIQYANTHNAIISEAELQKQLSLNKAHILGKYAAYIADSYDQLEQKQTLLENMLQGE